MNFGIIEVPNTSTLQLHLDPFIIPLPNLTGIDIVKIFDIVFCEADGNCSKVHLLNGKAKLVCKTLGEFEHVLPKHMFHRIHNSYIINLYYLQKYQKGSGGQVFMHNGIALNVSRSRKDEFLKRLYQRPMSNARD